MSCSSSSSTTTRSFLARSRRSILEPGSVVQFTKAAQGTGVAVPRRWHGGGGGDGDGDANTSGDAVFVHISFLQPDDTTRTVEARVGDSFLQVAHRHGIDLEGACEGEWRDRTRWAEIESQGLKVDVIYPVG
jgi:hypothetical protein